MSRGGDFNHPAASLRVSARRVQPADATSPELGVRCACGVARVYLDLQPDDLGGQDTSANSLVHSTPAGDPPIFHVDNGGWNAEWDDTEVILGYLRFELGRVPALASVERATLTLVQSQAAGVFGSNTISIRRVLSAWDESTLKRDNQPGLGGEALVSGQVVDYNTGPKLLSRGVAV